MPGDGIAVRLVEWNVAMSLQRKALLLADMKPTLAILPESAHPDKTWGALKAIGATSVEWVGSNLNKGLSVVAFAGWTLRLDEAYDPGYQWVMPLHLSGPRDIRVLAVWDMHRRGNGHQAARRLGACRASVDHYDQFLSGESDLTIISGDFNNSVYWDKPNKGTRFGDFMDQLESRGFVSAYHSQYQCGRGAELHPTLWWMKNVKTTYHIDYTFVSRPDTVEAVHVGSHEAWIAHSDHSPMTVDLRVGRLIKHSANSTSCTGPQGSNHRGSTDRIVDATDNVPREKDVTVSLTQNVRFPIEPDLLADMTCGVNGENFIQVFRPSYFTADWKDGVLKQVRIWGPRVLDDGSLGKRELDHRWKETPARGPVKYSDLPVQIADRLRRYNTENGLRGLP